MSTGLWLTIAVLALYIVQLVAILLMEHRRPAFMSAWMFIAAVLPFTGFAAYLLIGRKTARRRDAIEHTAVCEKRMAHAASLAVIDHDLPPRTAEDGERLRRLLAGLSPFPITARNRSKVLRDGEETFAAILKAMKRAKHHIHLDYYTIRADSVGDSFLRVLADKARKGVEVRVLYDGVGSWKLPKRYVDELRGAGAQVYCFAPPRMALLARRLNFRNHRKIVVVDGVTGFLGGINIGDEYIGLDPKLGYWRDTHLQLEGDAVYYLQELFMRDWSAAAGEELTDCSAYMPAHSVESNERVLVVPGKPGFGERNISESMVGAIYSARQKIYAATPYFIPDPAMAAGLRLAARSGADVRLIVPGISDSKLVMLATLSHVRDMLEAGVRVYRYQKGFIHSKVLIVDSVAAAIGTANLDMRSFYSNYEAMAVLFDELMIKRLESDFMNDLRDSKEIGITSYEGRSIGRRAAEAAVRILSPLF